MRTFIITSDASFNIKRMHFAWAFVLTAPGKPKIKAAGRFPNVPRNPTEAELMAIGHAANCLHLRHELKPGDTIIVNTDCPGALHYLRHHGQRERVHNERLRKITGVVVGTLNQRRGVSIDYRLVPESNPFIIWCHRKSKL